ncbi:MAG: hypothetical protein M3Z05_10740 [Gemmatimonadota bacterium]|nr:hypothetical protein [Gemmatimonadota bacterium]
MPHFVRADERARAALLRVRPSLVLIDCDHTEACSDEFVGPAIMTGARVILFKSNRSTHDQNDFSERLGLRIVNMPTEHEAITAIIKAALGE